MGSDRYTESTYLTGQELHLHHELERAVQTYQKARTDPKWQDHHWKSVERCLAALETFRNQQR